MKPDTAVSPETIIQIIKQFLASSPLNTLGDDSDEPAWDSALVGFVSGSDPLWQQYKEYVGPFHWTPWEVFNQHMMGENVSAEQLSVISWILPQRKIIRTANRRAKKYPSEGWARTRIYGEKFNEGLRKHMVSSLSQAGYPAIAPMLAANWTRVDSQRFTYASTWSERHAAYAAGLGTFGLCDGLITPRGKAMRVGSVVARIKLEPTTRPYSNHNEYCLYYHDGSCGKCIERCPADALSKAGHDKINCRKHLLVSRDYVKKNYQFEGFGCGLCQVGVPCESMIPVKSARKTLQQSENGFLSVDLS